MDAIDLLEGRLSDAVIQMLNRNHPSKEKSMCGGSETGRESVHLSDRVESVRRGG